MRHLPKTFLRSVETWAVTGSDLDLLAACDLAVLLVSFERLVQFVISHTEHSQTRLEWCRGAGKHEELGSEWDVKETSEQLVSHERHVRQRRLTVQQPVSTHVYPFTVSIVNRWTTFTPLHCLLLEPLTCSAHLIHVDGMHALYKIALLTYRLIAREDARNGGNAGYSECTTRGREWKR